MAILKKIPTNYGVDANYWNIGAVQEDFKGKGTQVTMYGYLDKGARSNGAQPLAAANIQLVGAEYICGATREELYAIIMAKPEFEGGVSDVTSIPVSV